MKTRDVLWPRIGLVRAWRYMMWRLARVRVSSHKLALGFAAGAFASFTPFIGFHFILAALLAYILRGNIIASAIGTVVGNPLTFPFIWLASYNLGAMIQGRPTMDQLDLDMKADRAGLWSDGPVAFMGAVWEHVGPYVVPMLMGGIPLGLLCGLICYFAVWTAVEQCKGGRSRPVAVEPNG
jgi:uncharacterized protein (DUF2062 family)